MRPKLLHEIIHYLHHSQCGNPYDFLSLRFYVKSILVNLEVPMPFLSFMGDVNFINLVNYDLQLSKNVKIDKNQNSDPFKMAIFETLHLPTLI